MNASPLRFPLFAALAAVVGSSVFVAASTADSLAWRRYEAPIFPNELAMTPVTQGMAVVVCTLDAAGRVEDAITVAATHPSFGDAILAVVSSWELEPAAGVTTSPRREAVRFAFRREGVLTSLTHRDAAKSLFSPSGDDAQAVTSLRWEELTAPPERLVAGAPVYPDALKARRASGTATVSFIIDEQGQVRVPAALSATEPEFGAAAVAAVKQWRFAPPRQHDRPVLVEAIRTFHFGPSAK
jgi:TonB family protein